MPRGRKPKPLHDAVDEWVPVRDARGYWVVVNHQGARILQHPDPMVRMHAVHLASRAPVLRELLRAMSARWRSYLLDHGAGYQRDMVLVDLAIRAIADTRPPFEDVRREVGRRQLELSLDDEPGVEGAAHGSGERRAGSG